MDPHSDCFPVDTLYFLYPTKTRKVCVSVDASSSHQGNKLTLVVWLIFFLNIWPQLKSERA